jgi:CBS domain containing-hemolysin-like protein
LCDPPQVSPPAITKENNVVDMDGNRIDKVLVTLVHAEHID